jgi:hypothetical protein
MVTIEKLEAARAALLQINVRQFALLATADYRKVRGFMNGKKTDIETIKLILKALEI